MRILLNVSPFASLTRRTTKRTQTTQVLKRGGVASQGCIETTIDSTPTARAWSVVLNLQQEEQTSKRVAKMPLF